jgi:hypothetical protein
MIAEAGGGNSGKSLRQAAATGDCFEAATSLIESAGLLVSFARL